MMTPSVVVIGAGIGGLRASIAAAEAGSSVLVVSESPIGAPHSIMAEGGVSVALGLESSEDSVASHLEDTLAAGHYLNDRDQATLLATEAPARIREAAEYGALLDRTANGELVQRAGPGGGHSHPRAVLAGDFIGLALQLGLLRRAARLGVVFQSDLVLTQISTRDGVCVGVAFVNLRDSSKVQISRCAVVIATGGGGRLYPVTTNSLDAIGDGYSLAARAGASLRDMEQVQFHPTALAWPISACGLLVTESVRGHGGRLFNSDGERFMAYYEPDRLELATRDVVARAIHAEIEGGRGIKGGVALDISHRSRQYLEEFLPNMVRQQRERCGIDIAREPTFVAPAAHHFMGGVVIEADHASVKGVEHLFACGEVVGGTHGANRLGGNSLAEALVFGRRAGEAAAASSRAAATRVDVTEGASSTPATDRKSEVATFREATKAVTSSAGHHLGVVRSEQGISAHMDLLRDMNVDLRVADRRVSSGPTMPFDPGFLAARRFASFFRLSFAIALSALHRAESRGAHFRRDFPTQASGPVRPIVLRSADGSGNIYDLA